MEDKRNANQPRGNFLKTVIIILTTVIIFNTVLYKFPQIIDIAPEIARPPLKGIRNFTEKKLVANLNIRNILTPMRHLIFSPAQGIFELYSKTFTYSKEIKENPVKELKVNVPKGAMDKALQLRASRLTSEQILKSSTDASMEGPVIAAYDISLGLKPEERLKKPMEISFQLDLLGIPAEEWKNLKVYRVEDNNQRFPMFSRLEGNQLKVYTTKNSVFQIVVAVAVGTPLVFYGMGLSAKGTSEYMGYNVGMSDGMTYRLLWSDKLKIENKELLTQIKARIINLKNTYINVEMKKMNPSDNTDYVNKVSGIIKNLRNRDDYKEMQGWIAKLVNSSGYPPFEVKQTEKALRDVHGFLTGIKGLPSKNVMGVDIVIRTKEEWPHTSDPKAVAMSVNQRGPVLPYVDIHGENIQDMNELYLNLTHELFHVWQDDYYFLQGLRSPYYLSFLEGTAVLVEYEAMKYFSNTSLAGGARIDKGVMPTDRDYYITLSNPMDDNDDEIIQRHHGYTMSHFLEYLRDNYYPDKEKYVKKLMDTFSSLYSFSTNKALYLSIGKSASELSGIFLKYCSENAEKLAKGILADKGDESKRSGKEKLFKDIEQNLTPDKPYLEWSYPLEKPLSCEFKFINVQIPRNDAFKEAKLLIVNNELEKQDVKLRASLKNQIDWKNYAENGFVISANDITKLSLQRISIMTNTSWILAAAGNTKIALMSPPNPPKVEKKDNGEIKVEIKKSIPAEQGLIKGYKLFIKAPGSAAAKEYIISDANNSQSFKLPDYESVSSDPKRYNKPYEIYYHEIAGAGSENQEHLGPQSGKVFYNLAEDAFVGRYVGKCAFDPGVPDSYEKAKEARLKAVADYAAAVMAQSGGNKNAIIDNQKDSWQNKTYQAAKLNITNQGQGNYYNLEAELPGLSLKGRLINMGTAPDRWAERYAVTDREGKKLGYAYFVQRDGEKSGQHALLVELEIADSPGKFGKDDAGLEWFPQKYTGYFYKEGNKPKLKENEILLKELFNK